MKLEDERLLSKEDIFNIIFKSQPVEIQEKVIDKVRKNYEFLKKFSKDKIIYGINTGLGPMSKYKVNDGNQKGLQLNLIRSHCSGAGEPLQDVYAKSVMLVRLNTLLQGYSGIHPEAIFLLRDFINLGIIPYIPEKGSVGASGDLVQLAHLALNLIGEGEVKFEGHFQPTANVLKKLNLKPISIHLREGLGIINGTSCMTGIGILNLLHAENLLNWSIFCSSLINEIVQSFDDHFSFDLNQTKLHNGQRRVAEKMRRILSDSALIRKREDYFFNGRINDDIFGDKVQEYYSLRCVPQILGPVYDTLENTSQVLINEINSVSDNPVIREDNNYVYHGGNFHGDYVSLEMDKLKIAITKLSMLSERQLNFLMNDKLNGILPPFVNLGILGFNLGMQGMQFTATSATAENQSLANPVYVHSIPNNNDNQDIVSMGTNAALIAKKVIDNAFVVLSIEIIALLQAVEFLKVKDKLAEKTKNLYLKLREIVPKFVEDTVKHKDIHNIKLYMQKNFLNFDS